MSSSLLKNLKFQHQLYRQKNKCCVCGMTNCEESTDHNQVTLQQLHELIQQKLSYLHKIQQIKLKVSEIYKDIKKKFISFLDQDQYQLQIYLNKVSFPFNLSKEIDSNFISQILEHNIQQIPSKKVSKITKKLKSTKKISQSEGFQKIGQKFLKLSQIFNFQTIFSEIKPKLPLRFFKQDHKQFRLKPKLSISQITNPQESDFNEDNKIYLWRNIKVTKHSKTVQMSNRNISDRQVMQQIPILSTFKNLKEFQIRNNKISCLSCNLIANNLPFLHAVDIRGNKITDKGILKLINGIPKLKSLSISQTLATDITGEEVANKLSQLEMFWSQHTKITNLIALKIAQKPKIKVLSLIGNPIDDQYKQKMKKIFISKGYAAV